MKFIMSRESMRWREAPCPEAKQELLTYLDRRTFNTLAKTRERLGDDWFNTGTNHREENGMVVREIRREEWMIEIKSLNGLMELRKQYKQLLIRNSYYKEYPVEIIIYD